MQQISYRAKIFAPYLGLSNETLCVILAQESAKLQGMKVSGLNNGPTGTNFTLVTNIPAIE